MIAQPEIVVFIDYYKIKMSTDKTWLGLEQKLKELVCGDGRPDETAIGPFLSPLKSVR